MPRWDDPRGPRHDPERERWRRDQMRDRGGPGVGSGGDERRSFGDSRRAEPGRYGGRSEDDRAGYGQRYEDAGAAGYALGRGARQPGEAYGEPSGVPYGQDYGLESEGGFGGGAAPGPDWGFAHDGERRRNFDFDDPGVGQSQAGYGERTQSRPTGPHPDHDFDPDYLRWREEQLRAHDRDYQAWRRDQHHQYDEQYRQFRTERQRHFGEAFHDWRSHRSAVGGVPDTGIAPGVSGYGDRTAMPGGYNAPGAYAKPSGMLDPPGHLSTDPAMQQRGGPGEGHAAARHAQTDTSPEFGKEPPQVQAVSEGQVQGHEHKAHKDEDQRH